MENKQNEAQLTPEELAVRKEEMKQFYDESLPYLESQVKYEKLLTEIEEARFKRVSYQYQFARMVGDGPEDEGKPEAPDRKLKKK